MDILSVTGSVLFSAAVSTFKELIVKAVSESANLYGANLRGADLYDANLRDANLRGANLYGANLRGADLYGADLRGANLRGAALYGANLHGANLCGANLHGANLHGANLSGADLYGADLYGANLRGANLRGANLRGANLRGANAQKLPIESIKVFSGLYRYEVWAVLLQDGSLWIRMGCLWYSLEKWEEIGIRESNLSEFPDDGSNKCEERVRAFEFAKDAVNRMKKAGE